MNLVNKHIRYCWGLALYLFELMRSPMSVEPAKFSFRFFCPPISPSVPTLQITAGDRSQKTICSVLEVMPWAHHQFVMVNLQLSHPAKPIRLSLFLEYYFKPSGDPSIHTLPLRKQCWLWKYTNFLVIHVLGRFQQRLCHKCALCCPTQCI